MSIRPCSFNIDVSAITARFSSKPTCQDLYSELVKSDMPLCLINSFVSKQKEKELLYLEENSFFFRSNSDKNKITLVVSNGALFAPEAPAKPTCFSLQLRNYAGRICIFDERWSRSAVDAYNHNRMRGDFINHKNSQRIYSGYLTLPELVELVQKCTTFKPIDFNSGDATCIVLKEEPL